jgi:hypothetical protein
MVRCGTAVDDKIIVIIITIAALTGFNTDVEVGDDDVDDEI